MSAKDPTTITKTTAESCDLPEDDVCAVCLEEYVDARYLPCGNLHTLCVSCALAFVRSNQARGCFPCPLCRNSVRIPAGGAQAFPRVSADMSPASATPVTGDDCHAASVTSVTRDNCGSPAALSDACHVGTCHARPAANKSRKRGLTSELPTSGCEAKRARLTGPAARGSLYAGRRSTEHVQPQSTSASPSTSSHLDRAFAAVVTPTARAQRAKLFRERSALSTATTTTSRQRAAVRAGVSDPAQVKWQHAQETAPEAMRRVPSFCLGSGTSGRFASKTAPTYTEQAPHTASPPVGLPVPNAADNTYSPPRGPKQPAPADTTPLAESDQTLNASPDIFAALLLMPVTHQAGHSTLQPTSFSHANPDRPATQSGPLPDSSLDSTYLPAVEGEHARFYSSSISDERLSTGRKRASGKTGLAVKKNRLSVSGIHPPIHDVTSSRRTSSARSSRQVSSTLSTSPDSTLQPRSLSSCFTSRPQISQQGRDISRLVSSMDVAPPAVGRSTKQAVTSTNAGIRPLNSAVSNTPATRLDNELSANKRRIVKYKLSNSASISSNTVPPNPEAIPRLATPRLSSILQPKKAVSSGSPFARSPLTRNTRWAVNRYANRIVRGDKRSANTNPTIQTTNVVRGNRSENAACQSASYAPFRAPSNKVYSRNTRLASSMADRMNPTPCLSHDAVQPGTCSITANTGRQVNGRLRASHVIGPRATSRPCSSSQSPMNSSQSPLDNTRRPLDNTPRPLDNTRRAMESHRRMRFRLTSTARPVDNTVHSANTFSFNRSRDVSSTRPAENESLRDLSKNGSASASTPRSAVNISQCRPKRAGVACTILDNLDAPESANTAVSPSNISSQNGSSILAGPTNRLFANNNAYTANSVTRMNDTSPSWPLQSNSSVSSPGSMSEVSRAILEAHEEVMKAGEGLDKQQAMLKAARAMGQALVTLMDHIQPDSP